MAEEQAIDVVVNFELSDEEQADYETKAAEIAERLGIKKVLPVVLVDRETKARVVAYLKNPEYITKVKIMDQATMSGIYTAGDNLRKLITIREDSDPLTYGEGEECDPYKMGIVDFCMTLIRRVQNQFKKK